MGVLKEFVVEAGGAESWILIIDWPTADPAANFEKASSAMKAYGASHFLQSVSLPKTTAEIDAFLKLLSRATGVFFTGGSQLRAMEGMPDAVKAALIEKYKTPATALVPRTPFGGTSAGMALMSKNMIYGGKIKPGLGLMSNVVFDTHFDQRHRQKRLIEALKVSGDEYAIGADENTGILIDDDLSVRAVGPGKVWVYRWKNNAIQEKIMLRGDCLRLDHWWSLKLRCLKEL